MRVVHVLRKPPATTVSQNILDHGCGGLNINASRIRTTEDTSRTLGESAYQLRKGSRGSAIVSEQGEAVDGSYARRTRPDQVTIAEYLDAALSAKGMTKADLARETGWGTTVYSWWDKNRNRVPTPEQWPIIKAILDLDDTYDAAMTEMVWVPRRERNEGSRGSGGRFPANMVLHHLPECEHLGTQRVPGRSSCKTTSVGQGREGDYTNGIYGAKASKVTTAYVGEDGLEPVDAWRCAPGCPVADLDEQSGISKSSGGRIGNKDGGHIYGGGKGLAGDYKQGDPGFGDVGGASRFYKQVR